MTIHAKCPKCSSTNSELRGVINEDNKAKADGSYSLANEKFEYECLDCQHRFMKTEKELVL